MSAKENYRHWNRTNQQHTTMGYAKPVSERPSAVASDNCRGAGGRKGRLAHYRETSTFSEPIQIMRDAPANDLDWFARYGALFDRHVRQGDPLDPCAYELGIPMELARMLVAKLRSLQCEDVARSLVPSLCSNLNTLPMLKQNAQYQQACEIGRHIMMQIARRDPKFVRQVVTMYSHAVHKRMQVVMTSVDDAYLGRALIEFVKVLKLPQISIRLAGYKIGDQRSDIEGWLKILGLPRDTHAHWISAANQTSAASMAHCGIEVLQTSKKGHARVSGAFHNVMILANVVEIWRLPFTAKSMERKNCRSPDQLPLFGGHHAKG